MNAPSISPWFWSSDALLWNYGDAISVLLIDELIHDFYPYGGTTHLIGSVIYDGIFSTYDESFEGLPHSLSDDREVKAVFWGCGIRAPGSLDPENYAAVELLAVRGPISASDLRLGGAIPQGDPALLLPALYKPRKSPNFHDKSVCVPHYSDTRTDEEIRRMSGCDAVLRSSVKKDAASVKAFIDALCSAKFVLAGAMHAAVTAAAYGIPFGFWDSGTIDIPTKWEDIAALLNFPCAHFEGLADAIDFYDREIAPVIVIPPLWPLLCVAPGFLKTAGILKVLKYEIERSTGKDYPEIDYFIEEMDVRSAHQNRIAFLANKMCNDMVSQKTTMSEERAYARSLIESKELDLVAIKREHEDALALQAGHKERIAALDHDNSALAQSLAEKSRLLDDACQQIERIAGIQEQLHQERAQAASDRSALQHQLEEAAAAIVHEAERFRTERARYDDERDGIAAENARLSQEIAESQREFGEIFTQLEDQKHHTRTLAMAHAEQLFAQQQAYHLLEENMGRLREEIAHRITTDHERAARAQAEFEVVERSLRRDLDRLSDENRAATAKNAALGQEVDTLKRRLVVAHSEVEAFRHEIGQLRDDLMLTEGEAAAAAAKADAALSQYWKLLERNGARGADPSLLTKVLKGGSNNIERYTETILQFLDRFSDSELGHPRADREKRVTQYLLGITPTVDDFPIFNRDIYLQLNPDVAEAGIEPFVHFINNGQWECRVIHPAMDIGYYVSRYPEVDKFKTSAIEHYFKYGVGKNYDPSSCFSTGWYLDHYADVKGTGVNPIVHYLRNPGCQPHPDFDSNYYRKSNPDVLRNGANPLAHYVLWGKEEGRLPAAGLSPAIPSVAAAVRADPPRPRQPAPAPAIGRAAVSGRSSLPSPSAGKPIVVMMDAFYPRPNEDSGSLDQVNFIRIFQNLGYDVAYIAMLNFGDAPETASELTALGAHCITATEFASIEEYLFLNQEAIEVMFLSRVYFGGAWIDRARAFCPKARILFNTVDLHHIREEREACLRGDAEGALHAQETRRLEYACISAADASIVVSEYERDLLARELPTARVEVVPLMREIPRTSFPDWHGRQHLAFIGGFQHQPNIDAVNHFLDEIWPIVRSRRPDLLFHVIGSHLPESLSGRGDLNVKWVGHVPEIEPWLDKVRLTVAPLRYGAGAKGKVVSSLINGVPCVATTVAAEGMGLRIGKDIVACQDPEDFADAILRVHDDADLWQSLSEQGFATISRTNSMEHAQNCVGNMLGLRT